MQGYGSSIANEGSLGGAVKVVEAGIPYKAKVSTRISKKNSTAAFGNGTAMNLLSPSNSG